MTDSPPIPLTTLLTAVDGVWWDEAARSVSVSGVCADSRNVRPGDLFVAIRGTRRDGHRYVRDALARGAAAVVASREMNGLGVPVARVEDARRALAELAATWYGRPADRLPLIGVTGTFGKTSVLAMIESILTAAGVTVGVIGSDAMGIRLGGRTWEESDLTTPDAVTLHRLLATMLGRHASLAGLEVTSQALEQRRVHGLSFILGVFTNIKLLEHIEYHGSFGRYVAAKTAFFRHVRDGAPLVYSADDMTLGELVKPHPLSLVGCGCADGAAVRISEPTLDVGGTHFQVDIPRPLYGADGGEVAPVSFDLRLGLLGWPSMVNAALAATSALLLGVDLPDAQRALAAFPPLSRRIEMVYRGRFTILDDSAGHPESMSAVFDIVQRVRYRRLHVVFAIRGRRGGEVNLRDAQSLALWSRKTPFATFVVTPSMEAVDEADRVEEEDQAAFLEQLERDGLPYEFRERMSEAVRMALDAAGDDDLVLLLGAQGMIGGREVVEAWLGERGEAPTPDPRPHTGPAAAPRSRTRP